MTFYSIVQNSFQRTDMDTAVLIGGISLPNLYIDIISGLHGTNVENRILSLHKDIIPGFQTFAQSINRPCTCGGRCKVMLHINITQKHYVFAGQ